MSSGNPLFPVFLKMDQINTLIVGGGSVGLEKLQGILKNDSNANVRVVARTVKSEILEKSRTHPAVTVESRRFRNTDLNEVDILILATNDRTLHGRIRKKARERNILVNVADTPQLCDFYLGSTVKKGDLKIGISTNGRSPTFAKRFREVLEEILPDETDLLLQNLRLIRNKLNGDFAYKVRKLSEITETLLREDEKEAPTGDRLSASN